MRRCLIVDDSRVIRTVSRHIVESFGFEVLEAANGEEAISLCETSMPELILLDWNMPVMNGLEFLSALRSTPGGAKPKVLFCTTEHDVAHVRQGLEAGADEYVMKPFDHESLRGKLLAVGLD